MGRSNERRIFIFFGLVVVLIVVLVYVFFRPE
jgi:tetrahydromethanopterin S-methyltransferase subunit G